MLNRRDATAPILEATSVPLASCGHVQRGRGFISKCGFLPSCIKKTVVSVETVEIMLRGNLATLAFGLAVASALA